MASLWLTQRTSQSFGKTELIGNATLVQKVFFFFFSIISISMSFTKKVCRNGLAYLFTYLLHQINLSLILFS